jgi:hypothetical protein
MIPAAACEHGDNMFIAEASSQWKHVPAYHVHMPNTWRLMHLIAKAVSHDVAKRGPLEH